MVGVMRYGEFDGEFHLTRPEVDPALDVTLVTEAFLRDFWWHAVPQTKKAVFIDYPEPYMELKTLGSIFTACGFEKWIDRTDMRLTLTQPFAPKTNQLTYTSYDKNTHARFLQAFEKSFESSLDPMMEWDATHPKQSFEMFRERFGHFEPEQWVLATDGKGQDVGFALFQHFQGGRYHDDTVLLYMAVLAPFRGLGYGEEIVREGLRRVRKLRGAQANVSLTVSKPNVPAAKIYQKIGFQPAGSFSVYRMLRS